MPKTSSDPMSPSSTRRRATATATAERSQASALLVESLRRVVRELRLAGRAAEQQVGVHGAQLFALQCLAESPASSLTELAERTHTDISSASVVVSRLVERGLVARRFAPDDRRRLTLTLTAQGKAVLRRTPESSRDRLLQATEGLSDRELRALATGLRRLADDLRSEQDETAD